MIDLNQFDVIKPGRWRLACDKLALLGAPKIAKLIKPLPDVVTELKSARKREKALISYINKELERERHYFNGSLEQGSERSHRQNNIYIYEKILEEYESLNGVTGD